MHTRQKNTKQDNGADHEVIDQSELWNVPIPNEATGSSIFIRGDWC